MNSHFVTIKRQNLSSGMFFQYFLCQERESYNMFQHDSAGVPQLDKGEATLYYIFKKGYRGMGYT